jgi:hypothetical protein
MSPRCQDCKHLLDQAVDAAVRHLEAVGRLDLARLCHEGDMIPELQLVVEEAARARVGALANYRNHRGLHHLASTASGAA